MKHLSVGQRRGPCRKRPRTTLAYAVTVYKETRQWAEAVLLLWVSWLGARLAGAWLDHGCKWVGPAYCPSARGSIHGFNYKLLALIPLWHPLAPSGTLWPSPTLSDPLSDPL
jgi:hypothetical protein